MNWNMAMSIKVDIITKFDFFEAIKNQSRREAGLIVNQKWLGVFAQLLVVEQIQVGN